MNNQDKQETGDLNRSTIFVIKGKPITRIQDLKKGITAVEEQLEIVENQNDIKMYQELLREYKNQLFNLQNK